MLLRFDAMSVWSVKCFIRCFFSFEIWFDDEWCCSDNLHPNKLTGRSSLEQKGRSWARGRGFGFCHVPCVKMILYFLLLVLFLGACRSSNGNCRCITYLIENKLMAFLLFQFWICFAISCAGAKIYFEYFGKDKNRTWGTFRLVREGWDALMSAFAINVAMFACLSFLFLIVEAPERSGKYFKSGGWCQCARWVGFQKLLHLAISCDGWWRTRMDSVCCRGMCDFF